MNGTDKENKAAQDAQDAQEAFEEALAAEAEALAAADAAREAELENVTPLDSEEGIEAELKTYEDLASENEALKDRLLRALSDGENLRRRSQREKEDAAKYAISAFARDLLEVSDNLTRALASVAPEDIAAGGQHLSTLFEGVELTEKGLQAAYDRHQIKLVDPKGERFDPNFHQAVAEIPGTDNPHGTVVDVMQTGYIIGERLLRPAMVTVAKGEPKAGGNPGDSVDTTA